MTERCFHHLPPGMCVVPSCPHFDGGERVTFAAPRSDTPGAERKRRLYRRRKKRHAAKSPWRAWALKAAEIVAREFDLDASNLMGGERLQEYVTPRHLLWWALRRTSRRPSYPGIAWACERDQSTIRAGVQSHAKAMEANTGLYERTLRLLAEIEHADQQRGEA